MPGMSEERLAEIKTAYAAWIEKWPEDAKEFMELIAEVERLREENEKLQACIRGGLAACLKVVDKINNLAL